MTGSYTQSLSLSSEVGKRSAIAKVLDPSLNYSSHLHHEYIAYTHMLASHCILKALLLHQAEGIK